MDTIRTYGRNGLQIVPRWYLFDERQSAPERLKDLLRSNDVEYRSAYVDDELQTVLVRNGPLCARRRIRPGLCLPTDPTLAALVLEGLALLGPLAAP